jgi:hypothetical protein
LTNCYIPESVIEYIDPDEQNLSMIAMKSKIDNLSNFNYRYTHCEIHEYHIRYSGVVYSVSGPTAENVYQTAMKQALGIYSLNYDQRDKTAYVLSYPSRPMVDTH